MKSATYFFHCISYLQYPIMLVGVFYVFKPYFTSFDSIWESLLAQ